ncbi:DnaD domain protein [Paenibacillus brasilensis]|uniref:Replication initiation and membrane attachment protein n=1 Tax=Paenibacillus brasilensis TaxID=128574 RepID=A0ABU0L4J8_9BACL|nr:DnaD domain protein [Paenibacillus brasilensis]MDQ0496175.1 replication initiation and membrane attachment protein [Paenibacillus brasilensis]
MRMKNLLHYTENHRYCVYREFGLSALDELMLGSVYQPMVGAFAVSLYRLLFQHVPAGQIGYSPLEQQRRLFLTLGLEPSEKGRKYLIEQTSKLEAVGLLQTSRLYAPETDDYMYEYEMQPPLAPAEFFRTQHLTLLLRDKIGKFAVLSLRESLWSRESSEWSQSSYNKENISVPFYELFELNTHVIDYELEQALSEVSTGRQTGALMSETEEALNYADIILRFPRESVNRKHVERLRFEHEQLGMVNYVVRKFGLSVQDISRLLDEDGIFTEAGDLLLDELQLRASQQSRQDRKRQEEQQVQAAKVVALRQREASIPEEPPAEQAVEMEFYVEVPPQFTAKCDIHQYNMMLRNEPYRRLLQTFFPGTVPGNLLDIFEKIDISYKLPGEVINVLIHYLMSLLVSGSDQRINRNFVEAVASNMLLKQVNTYEKAVQYIRDQAKVKGKQSAASTSGGRTRSYGKNNGSAKPSIPIVQDQPSEESVSEEELDELLRLAERMQSGKQKKV